MPNNKHQITNKSQITMIKIRNVWNLNIACPPEAWRRRGIYLSFGFWDLIRVIRN